MTCAVLRARTCALFRAYTKVAAFGRHHRRGGAAFGRPHSVVSFVLALNKAHVLALNTAHVLRLNKARALALNKARVLRLNTKICPVFTAQGAALGLLHKGGRPSAAARLRFPLCWL